MKQPVLTNKLLRRDLINLIRSTETITPACQHAPPNDFCGGCTFQERHYDDQVRGKHTILQRLWSDLLPEAQWQQIGFIASPEPLGYRTRMDFVVSKGRCGLRRGGKFNYIIDLQECLLIPSPGFAAIRTIYQAAMEYGLPDYNLRDHQGFLRYLVVRRSPTNQYLIAAITASEHYSEEMEQLATLALSQPGVIGFHWLLNPGKADTSFGTPLRHWGATTLPMTVGRQTLQIGPNTFFQNNLALLEPLLHTIYQACATNQPQRIADLYGGVGTIALHLASAAQQVTCVESVSESVTLAQHNISANQVTNVQAIEADVAEYLRSCQESFDLVVVDPPRTGLGPDVCASLLRLNPARIVYLSCNPLTQREDAQLLMPTYHITQLDGYDMFPQTPHLETLAIFDR